MLGNFYPPVIFEVKAIAGEAMATFGGINKQLKVMEAQATKTGRALTTMNKAAIVGTKILKGLGVAFAAFAAIGVKEVIDLEKAFTRLGKAMANVGVSTAENRRSVAELVDSYENLGFGADKAADAFAVLITATGDVDKANKLLATSADLARARNIGLEESAKLLIRAQRGNARLFSQFGIELDKTLPKAQATEKAMGDLANRLGGQALAYTKTFAGQLLVLQENIGDLAEAIGGRILPVLNRFLGALNNTGNWVKKNNDLVIALAVSITVLLIPAVVNLTKKLIALSVTLLRNPLTRFAILLGLVALQFVKTYNAAEEFRSKVGTVVKFALAVIGTFINGLENLYQAILMPEKAVLKLGQAWAKFRGDEKKLAEYNADLAAWEKSYNAVDKWSDGIENAKRKVDAFTKSGIKLDIKDLLPAIPGFENQDFAGVTDGLDKGVKKALDNARQRFKDFARDIREQFRDIGKSFADIVGKDFESTIKLRLADPVTQFKAKLTDALKAYDTAMGSYAQANQALAQAQGRYVAAIKSGNAKLIASAESAVRYAEQGVSKVMDSVKGALEDIQQIQDDIINAVVEAQKEIASLEEERAKVLADAQKERLRLEDDYNKQVKRLRKDYDKSVIAAEADAAKRRAEIIKTSVDQMRSAFRSATYRTLGDVYQGLTFEGRYLKGGSMEKILSTLGLQTAKAKKLANSAAGLAGLGFSQTFIEEVIALGPDMGNSLAETILKATPESIKQLQEYWKELETTSSHGVDNIAKNLNMGVTLATEELTQQLADVETELNATLKALNQDLTDSLLEAWTAYSEAVDEINNRTTEAIAAIDAQIQALKKTISELMAMLAMLKALQNAPAAPAPAPAIDTKPTGVTDVEWMRMMNAKSQLVTSEYGSITSEYGSKVSSSAIDYTKTSLSSQVNQLASARYEAMSKSVMAQQKANRDTAPHYLGAGATINITANTNATAQDIANEVGWSIRTSGDVQYRTMSSTARGEYK